MTKEKQVDFVTNVHEKVKGFFSRTSFEPACAKSIVSIRPTEEPKVAFDNLILQDVASGFNNLLDYLTHPKKYAKAPGYMPCTRILVLGEADTGKSTLIRAFAHKAGLALYKVNASSILASKNYRLALAKLFTLSTDAHYVLEIDDFNLFAAVAAKNPVNVINVVTALKRTADMYPNVILIATASSLDTTDKISLSVYNTFKNIISMELPTLEERKALLKELTNSYYLDETVDLDILADSTDGMSIGDIVFMVNEAIGFSKVGKRNYLIQDDFVTTIVSTDDCEVDESQSIMLEGIECTTPDITPSVLWDDIVVKGPAEELAELADYVIHPEKYNEDYTPETRILFAGTNDSGRDTLIRAFAYKVQLPIYKINASRIIETEDTNELLEALFNFSDDKYILVIDSFNDFTTVSSESSSYVQDIVNKINQYSNAHPNVLLFGTDDGSGDSDKESIYLMFKKGIPMENPNQEERISLLNIFTKNLTLKDVDIAVVAKGFISYNVGEMKYMVKKAIGIAHHNKRDYLIQDDFFDAIDSESMGESGKKHNDEMQRLVAYHEAGHALIQYLLFGKESLLRVISVSRGDAGGYTMPSPEEDKLVHTMDDILNNICVDYGGRAAEKLVFNHYSTGASADIDTATATIMNMIRIYGMSDRIGPINLAPRIVYSTVINPSNNLNEIVYEEAQRIAKECYDKAYELLKTNRKKLDVIAEYLIQNESLKGELVADLLNDVVEDSATAESSSNG